MKILLVFTSYEQSTITCSTLGIEPDSDKFIVHVVPESPVRIDIIDDLYQQYYDQCNRVVIIDRLMKIPEQRILPCYFPVKRAFELEQGMDMVWTNEQRNKISERILTNVRPVVQSLLNRLLSSSYMIIRERPERTPLSTTWEERLKETPSKRTKTDDESICVVCLDNESVVMWAPCMHQCVCDVCAKELMERNDQTRKCPLCREPITDLFRPIK